jgi:hypothetical protein
MDAETPTRGKKKDGGICTMKKKDISFGGTLVDLDPGDSALPTWTLAFEGLGCHLLARVVTLG